MIRYWMGSPDLPELSPVRPEDHAHLGGRRRRGPSLRVVPLLVTAPALVPSIHQTSLGQERVEEPLRRRSLHLP